MSRVRTAIVGCGKVGHLHAAALRSLPEAEFVAVCGRTPEKAAAFGAAYGVPSFTNVTEMAEKAKVEAVCICTPHPQHAAPMIAAAAAGVHALVEKPLASSLEDCDAMLAAARAHGTMLGTVCQRRFYPPCQRIHAAIQSGKLGQPVLGAATMFGWRDEAYYRSDPWRGRWREEGGGVLVNQSPHQLDLLLWYLGGVAEVFGYWANLNHPYIEVEDTAVAVVRFQSGALGNIIVSNSQNPALHARVSVHGANGASAGVQTDGGAMFIAGTSTDIEPPYNDLWTIPGETAQLPEWKEEDARLFASVKPMEYFHRLQIQDFLRAVRDGKKPLVTGEDGRRTVELFTAIYQASQTGRALKFPIAGGSSPA
ncbi:MAG TPA: Gfo/Idh/MocA family oxidoreductase [Verrucomicrobiae bacterium]|jgi:predicted dehydrogenase|nr:Gfo/Idh/MocA family oxidoreductase [Verrucomicrobiae bacterium]